MGGLWRPWTGPEVTRRSRPRCRLPMKEERKDAASGPLRCPVYFHRPGSPAAMSVLRCSRAIAATSSLPAHEEATDALNSQKGRRNARKCGRHRGRPQNSSAPMSVTAVPSPSPSTVLRAPSKSESKTGARPPPHRSQGRCVRDENLHESDPQKGGRWRHCH